MINRVKVEEPLSAELAESARELNMCTLRQFMSRIEIHLLREVVKALGKTPKPLSPPGRVQHEEEFSPKKRKKKSPALKDKVGIPARNGLH
jgi:hypothetical protein